LKKKKPSFFRILSGHRKFEMDWIDGFNHQIESFPEDVRQAHKHSIHHKPEIMKSNRCGCFYCCSIFTPDQIKDWVDEGDVTALCPICGIDSVIGDHSGFEITKEFLEKMKLYWFEHSMPLTSSRSRFLSKFIRLFLPPGYLIFS
jgi:hypothetical protein